MTGFKEAVKSSMTEYLEELKTKLDGLTDIELRWQATLDTNTILWLVWHMADVEASWINEAIAGGETVWDTSDWTAKTGIKLEVIHGRGLDGVREMPEVDVADLVQYYDEVRASTFRVIDGISDEDLSNIDARAGGSRRWDWILGHVVVEESQQLGQIALIRGMIRGLDG